MLTLTIDAALFDRFPALRISGFAVADLDIAMRAISEAELRDAVAGAAAALASSGITADKLAGVPAIEQWRQAFAACGLPPSIYRGRVESGVRALLGADRPISAVPAVTLAGAMSARHLAPVSGYDVDALPGSTVSVRAARPLSDWFVPLGARPNDIPSNPAVVVYAAGQTVLCWGFNHRDSRQTSLRAETRRAVFFSEAVAPLQAAAADSALADLRGVLQHLGARLGALAVADRSAPTVAMRFR